jgi:hypothetical protein
MAGACLRGPHGGQVLVQACQGDLLVGQPLLGSCQLALAVLDAAAQAVCLLLSSHQGLQLHGRRQR